jgi:hypothetical protein
LGHDVYISEIQRALTSNAEPWTAFVDYLRRIVTANTLGLTVRLAGTFTLTAEQMALAERMQSLCIELFELFERLKASGALRSGITDLHIDFLLEFLAEIRFENAERSAELGSAISRSSSTASAMSTRPRCRISRLPGMNKSCDGS